MSNLVEHAKRELKSMLESDEEINRLMANNILEIVETFSKQGHSGFSASYAIGVLTKLLNWEPFGPLTGEDSEWHDPGGDSLQNIRCSRVFKDKATGRTYDIEGKVFRSKNGGAYTNRDSHVDVTFPYTPKTEYVEVEE